MIGLIFLAESDYKISELFCKFNLKQSIFHLTLGICTRTGL